MAIQVLGELHGLSVGVHEILYSYYFAPLASKEGFYHLRSRDGAPLVEEPSRCVRGNHPFGDGWNSRYVFVKIQELPEGSVRIRRFYDISGDLVGTRRFSRLDPEVVNPKVSSLDPEIWNPEGPYSASLGNATTGTCLDFTFCRSEAGHYQVVPLLQGLARIGGVWRPDPAPCRRMLSAPRCPYRVLPTRGTVLCLSRQGYYRYLFGFHILPLRSWPLSSSYAVFYFCRKSLTGLEGAGVVPLLQGLARIGGVWRPDPAPCRRMLSAPRCPYRVLPTRVTELEPELGRYVATELEPKFGRYVATELF
ncbi:hypothetical protein F2Q70_00029560 [Brassica cretica]|uniref:Uncharacterized protein n=1 Tax=Brassica cretica TaxID=69181 RepID=A0A8S9FNS5_BRACR|nr:hypothetical protein F2Q70_00029560 [Brassica cretica]